MTRVFFIDGFPTPVSDPETAKYWEERGKRITEVVEYPDGWKLENPRKITEGSGK
jgi:hypothetical protein